MSARDKFSHALLVSGCDDSTTVGFLLTPREADFLTLVAEKVTEVGGGCAPTMSLHARDADGWEADYAWGVLDEPEEEPA